jgi:cell fate regulator YaaT (PSP1 superfamily)
MPEVVGIRFKPFAKMYYFSPGKIRDLAPLDAVIVETSVGEELAWVVTPLRTVSEDTVRGKLKAVLRRANPVDLATMEEYRQREEMALARGREKAAELDLPMKIIKAEYSFNGQRILFFFFAEERVDFRELVQTLARSFRKRIEMKQIGPRDEAKLIGGYGPCGRPLCCTSWLTEFHPVSIRMAKQQNLPLAPAEISGLCGRLLCCLAYEYDQYVVVKNALPKVGTQVTTSQGKGTVVDLNILTETVTVRLQDDLTVEMKAGEATPLPGENRVSRDRKKGRK